jgi:hypothetical protein
MSNDIVLLKEMAAAVKIEREKEYNGLNTWSDWDNRTFVDMVLSKMERAYQSLHQPGGSKKVEECLRDGYNYLLELKRRLD